MIHLFHYPTSLYIYYYLLLSQAGLSLRSLRQENHSIQSAVTSYNPVLGTCIANYRGLKVSSGHVTDKAILLTRTDLMELKLVRTIRMLMISKGDKGFSCL